MHALGSATLVAAVVLACAVWAQPSLLQAAFVQDASRWLIATVEWGRAALVTGPAPIVRASRRGSLLMNRRALPR